MKIKNLNRKSIAVIQLQHDIVSRSLKIRAISEVLAKVLYQHQNEPLTINQLKSKAAGLTELPQVQIEIIESGLKWLKENGWANESTGKWKLTEEGQKKISSRHTESEDRVAIILKKHFTSNLDQSILRPWFLEASILFFSKYGEVISRALLREDVSLPSNSDLQTILVGSITKAELEKHKESLVTGFHSFLNDIDPKSEAQKISFALATLSARLIAAAAGPDPISLSEFENSKLFLDTNVLLLEKIEIKNGETSLALVALAEALKSIGAELHIIRHTKNEYEGVVSRKRSAILKALKEGVSITVLEKSRDPFLRMAIKNLARNEEDFIRFFDSISEAPSSIGSVGISLLEFPELQDAIEKGVKDSKKKTEINNEWKKLHGKDKGSSIVEHDAALNAAVIFHKKEDGKAWVITRDKSMLNLSKQWHEHEGLPAWVYLEALVEVLAVYGAGPTYKPEEFAPLLGTLIRSDVQETFANFQIEDLGDLADLDSRVFELSDEEVISFAEKLHQMKLSGESEDSSDFQLNMRRTFQGRRLADNKEAEKARTEIVKREQKIKLMRDIGVAALVKELLPKIKWRRKLSWVPYLIAVPILSWFIYENWSSESWRIGLIIALLIDVFIPLLIMLLSSSKRELQEEAKIQAEEVWEAQNKITK